MKRSFVVLAALLLVGQDCKRAQREVVVYTSVDQPFAEPIFRDFEKRSAWPPGLVGVMLIVAAQGAWFFRRLLRIVLPLHTRAIAAAWLDELLANPASAFVRALREDVQ